MPKKNLGNLISVSLVGRLLGNGLQYCIYVVIGRYLGPKALGLFTFGFVILNIGTMFSQIGLDKAVKKFVPIYRDSDDSGRLSGTLLISLLLPFCLGSAFSLILYFSSDTVGQYFSDSFGETTILFLAGVPFMAVMTVGRAATTGFIQTKYSVYIRDVCQTISAFILVVFSSLIIGTVKATIVGYVLSLVVASGLALYYIHKLGGFAGLTNPIFEVRQILTYSLPLTLAAFAQYLISWTDVVMLGAFDTPAGIGRYQAAYQTAVILGFLLGAANSIFPSVASDLYQKGEWDRLREMYAALTKWLTYLTTLGFVFIIMNASDILSIFGNEFTGAGLILAILAGVFTFTTAVGPAGFLLMMTDYERLEMSNTFVAAILNITLNFILIQQLGVLGAAIATGCSQVLVNTLRLAETWLLLKIRPYISSYWKGGLAILIASPLTLVGGAVFDHHLVKVMVSGVLTISVFGVAIFLLGFDTIDRRLFEKLA